MFQLVLEQFIGTILALAAILVPILIYLRQRSRKELSYKIISCTPLLSMEKEVEGKIEILYDRKPVDQVHLVEIEIFNSGNVPIKESDWEHELSLDFGENAEMLSTEISETPTSIKAVFQVEGSKGVLFPTLLNQGDSIRLKLLVGNFNDQIDIDARIVGVKEIKETSEKPARYLYAIFCGLFFAFTGFIGLILIPPPDPLHDYLTIMFFAGYFLSCIVALGFMFEKGGKKIFQFVKDLFAVP